MSTISIPRGLFAALLALWLFGCKESPVPVPAAEPAIEELSVNEVERRLKVAGTVLFDVNARAYLDGQLPGAQQMLTGDYVVPESLPEDRATPLIFYCKNRL